MPLDLSVYRPALLSFFRKRARRSDVEDLVQDVFLNIQARRAGGPIENVEGYLFAVAASVLTKQRRRRWSPNQFDELDEAAGRAGRVEISPERILLEKENLNLAVQILAALPDRTQQVFLLHRFEEMTYSDIARSLGISVSAVEKHIMIALSRLVTGLEAAV